jgi:hypothetical protein
MISLDRPTIDDEADDRASELLNQVNLITFQAAPQELQPFESTVLRWNVEAPSGVQIKLNGESVAKSGRRAIQPDSTQTYRLYARVPRASRFLGSVTVSVNVSQCESRDSTIIDELLVTALKQEIENNEEVYFRLIQIRGENGLRQYVQSQPEVTMTTGRIRFNLKLEAEVNNFPNPAIDIDASFGLKVVPSASPSVELFPRTELAATDVALNVNVSFPWEAYLVPGASVALPIAADMAEDRVRAIFTNAINQLVSRVINASINPSQPGLQKNTVRIYQGFFGGTVEVDFCPVREPDVIGGVGLAEQRG